MFISWLCVKDFRLFKNNDFKIGKYVTAIAGFNTTGKSTLLGLLGHCGQLRGYKPLLHSSFRAELSEIIKFSANHDVKIPDIGTITFEDVPSGAASEYPNSISYRSTKQKGNRYRIIPKKTETRPTVNKISWPTLYLGLGRLYPVGESENVQETPLVKTLSDTEKKFILNNMDSILSTNEHPKDFTTASISETPKKKAVGLITDKYDYLCNSAGQDNLGQILVAILSFRKLKEQLADKWRGGLLLIDELDATLHPLSQNKLAKFVYDQASELGMQIIFTTHSLSLLDYICKKTEHNSGTTANNYELIYIKNANGPIEVTQSPSFEAIYNDLMATYHAHDLRKLPIFSEDAEARYFISKLLGKYAHRFNLLEAPFSHDSLLGMRTSDYNNFCRYLYIVDGDVPDDKIAKYAKKVAPAPLGCIMKLPGSKRPEQVLWEYIENMQPGHPFLEWGDQYGYTIRSFKENSPHHSDKYKQFQDDRNKYKNWFKDNEQLINDIFSFWCADNKAMIDKFIADFIETYNWVATKSFIPKITDSHTGS